MRYLLLLFALSFTAFAQCSLQSVRGTWAYQSRGTMIVVPPGGSTPTGVPYVGMGIEKIDYTGGFTVDGLVNIGGQIRPVKVSGTINVDSGCTATDSYSVGGTSRTDRLVILDDGREMRMMGTNGGAAGTAEFRRLFWSDAECTADMLHGVYAGAAEGLFTMVPPGQKEAVTMPFSMISSMTFQWDGTGTGTSTMSIGGSMLEYPFSQMSLKVNADCTGSSSWKGGPKGLEASGGEYTIVLGNGKEIWTMQTANTGGTPITIGRFKRTSTVPVPPKW